MDSISKRFGFLTCGKSVCIFDSSIVYRKLFDLGDSFICAFGWDRLKELNY